MAVGGLKVLNIDARAPGLCICLHPCIWFRHYVKMALRKAVALLPEHAVVAYTTSRATRVDIMRTRAHRRVNRWTHSCNCLSWRPCFLRVRYVCYFMSSTYECWLIFHFDASFDLHKLFATNDPWETLWQREAEEQVERQRLKKQWLCKHKLINSIATLW